MQKTLNKTYKNLDDLILTRMKHKIAVLYGSYRSGRRGIKLAKFVMDKLEERGHEVIFLDAKEIDLPIIDKMYSEFENPPKNMKKAAGLLEEADAYVIISGEYNHSIQPGLKNFLDHYMKEYFFKPSGIVTYSKGIFAGVRNVHNIRAILGEIGTVSIPTIFSVPSIDKGFGEGGKVLDENYHNRIKQFLDELEWYTEALKKQREKSTPY